MDLSGFWCFAHALLISVPLKAITVFSDFED